jgi:hypothetical protein
MDKKPIRVLPVEAVQTLNSLKTAIEDICTIFGTTPADLFSKEQEQCDKEYAESLKDCEE